MTALKVQVENYRGAHPVRFELDGVTMIAGSNGAGKSSIAEAVGRLLSGTILPAGLAKKDAGLLVKRGTERASVAIFGPEGEGELSWPECRLTTAGVLPDCSAIAAGLQRPTSYLGSAGKEFWAGLLRVEVTAGDFQAAVQEKGASITKRDIEGVVKMIEKTSAAQATLDLRKRATELKGAWERASGQGRWGEKKAMEFRPVGLNQGLNYEAAVERVARLREDVARAGAGAAVREEERAKRLQRVQGTIEVQKALEQATLTLKEADEHLEKHPNPQGRTPIPCPHCGKPLDLISEHRGAQHRIVAMEPKDDLPAAEMKARRQAHQEAQHDRDKASARWEALKAERASLEADEAWLKANPELDTNQLQRDRLLADELSTAAREVDDYRAWREAHDINDKIVACNLCADLCDPKGPVASKKAEAVVGTINGVLDDVRTNAGFGQIVLHRSDEGEFSATWNGIPYSMLSAGERAAVDIAIQIAMATVDGSQIVIIDDAEALDLRGWNGVLAAIQKGGFSALCAYTQARKKDVPDLAKVGIGRSYWMAKGEISPIEGEAA